jgi:hypothetical protein
VRRGISRRSVCGEAAAHGGARVASEGLDPHSQQHSVFVGSGGVVLMGAVFGRYGPARIRAC